MSSCIFRFWHWIKIISFNIWARYFEGNFKDTLWNSTQNISPIHWEMCILLRVQNSILFMYKWYEKSVKWQSATSLLNTSIKSWWCHQMETFSVLLALCVGNSPVTGEFLSQRPVMWSFVVFFDLRLNKRLSKQSWGWWFEMPSCWLWSRHNGMSIKRVWALASLDFDTE